MSSPIELLHQRTAKPEEEVRVIPMDGEDADDVLDSLSADTRRESFRALLAEPATASELADELDTSVQNAHYHVTNLEAAGLVEAIDTDYSEKGNEMTVYGPASDPIVFVGDEDAVPRVERSLSGVVTGLGLLAAASLLVQWGAERLARTGVGPISAAGPSSTAPADPASPGMAVWLVFEVLEPGVLFFAGSLVVAALVTWQAGR